MRMDYAQKMGGVDVADQQNGAHAHDHKSYTNFWRRVTEAKIQQGLTNGWLITRKKVDLLIREVEDKLKDDTERAEGDLTLVELDEASTALGKLRRVERSDWNEKMAAKLMSKCGVAKVQKGQQEACPFAVG